MKLAEVKSLAKTRGVPSISKYKSKADLIRAIQVAEGNSACFQKIPDCAQGDCLWREDCMNNA